MQGNQRETDWKWAYIAGIIDGEGSFMISRSTCGYKRKTPQYTPRIKVAMTDSKACEFIHKFTGIGTFTHDRARPSRPTRKGLWLWQTHSVTHIPEFIERILPFLTVRLEHAKHLLHFCRNYKKTRKPMDGVPKEELAFREDAYWKMRELNGKQVLATTNPWDTRESEVIV